MSIATTGRDEELVSRAAAGDAQAFEELYTRYFAGIYDFAFRTVRDNAVAADVVHDTFLRAWESLRKGTHPQNFRAWLYAIARNNAIDEMRRAQRTIVSSAQVEGRAECAAQVDTSRLANPYEVVRDRELVDLVWQAAASLSPRDYTLLDLHLRQQLSSEELASSLGIRRDHLLVLLSRLRHGLEELVTFLLLARRGRKECPELDALLHGDDATPLTAATRQAVRRHLAGCPACRERSKHYMSPAEIFAGLAMVPIGSDVRTSVWHSIEAHLGAAVGTVGVLHALLQALSATLGWSAPPLAAKGVTLTTGAVATVTGVAIMVAVALPTNPVPAGRGALEVALRETSVEAGEAAMLGDDEGEGLPVVAASASTKVVRLLGEWWEGTSPDPLEASPADDEEEMLNGEIGGGELEDLTGLAAIALALLEPEEGVPSTPAASAPADDGLNAPASSPAAPPPTSGAAGRPEASGGTTPTVVPRARVIHPQATATDAPPAVLAPAGTPNAAVGAGQPPRTPEAGASATITLLPTPPAEPTRMVRSPTVREGAASAASPSATPPSPSAPPAPSTGVVGAAGGTPGPPTSLPVPTTRPGPPTWLPVPTHVQPGPPTAPPVPSHVPPGPPTSRPSPTDRPWAPTSAPDPTNRPGPPATLPVPTHVQPGPPTGVPVPTNRPGAPIGLPVPTPVQPGPPGPAR